MYASTAVVSIGEITAGAAVLSLAVFSIAALAWRGSLEDRGRPRKARPAGGSRQAVPDPIILVEDGSVELYDSVEAAECSCEAIDVWDGLFVAYDANGRPLALHVDERDLVWMEPEPDGESAVEEVSEHLRRYVAACRSVEGDLDAMSLQEILQLARTLDLVEEL